MAVKYRPGHVSLKTAMRILRVDYSTVVRWLVTGTLDGGHYRGKQRSRFVTWTSVRNLHRQKLAEQIATYDTVREQLEGVLQCPKT